MIMIKKLLLTCATVCCITFGMTAFAAKNITLTNNSSRMLTIEQTQASNNQSTQIHGSNSYKIDLMSHNPANKLKLKVNMPWGYYYVYSKEALGSYSGLLKYPNDFTVSVSKLGCPQCIYKRNGQYHQGNCVWKGKGDPCRLCGERPCRSS